MRITLHGGFGEKGRTCIGVESDETRLLLDVGIKTSARGRGYYPALSRELLASIDAILVTHSHEDHIGALGWCAANGFSGPVFMTRETRNEAEACLAAYAEPEHRAVIETAQTEIFHPGDRFEIGDLAVSTGRSGHAVGGVWFSMRCAGRSLLYCGDIVPDSTVLVFDPVPECDVLLFDASYGDDAVPSRARIASILEWVKRHPRGCLLPTPLTGRSLELLAILSGRVAVHESMIEPLHTQIAERAWLKGAMVATIADRIAGAAVWREGDPLPSCPLLTHDGMGLAGPSRSAIDRAHESGYPILFTGHLPEGSPGDVLCRRGDAAWIRLPTHPTLDENLKLLEECRPQVAIGHSCEAAAQERLKPHRPDILRDARTGDSFVL